MILIPPTGGTAANRQLKGLGEGYQLGGISSYMVKGKKEIYMERLFGAFGVLFAWIFLVLLTYLIWQGPQTIYLKDRHLFVAQKFEYISDFIEKGDVVNLVGTWTDTITISKSYFTLDGRHSRIEIEDNEKVGILIKHGVSNVTIRDCTVIDATYAISISEALKEISFGN